MAGRRWLAILLGVWFAAAFATSAAGVWTHVSWSGAAMIPVIVLTISTLVLGVPVLRKASESLCLHWLISVHVLRWFGGLFLIYAGTTLPHAWAWPAGIGDIAVAVLAVPAAMYAMRLERGDSLRPLHAFNVFGIADILLAPLTASYFIFASPGTMSGMQSLPLALVPTFFVPLMIVGHLLLTVRLRVLAKERAV